ncbi:MAG: hypothetical protein V4622_01445 [Bacteroidota bacterium]
MKKLFLLIIFIFVSIFIAFIYSQEKLGFGIGILPTGSETGINFRSSKQDKLVFDLRISKANVFFHTNSGSFINEVSLSYRVAYQEKLRFNLGLGTRAEWNLDVKQTQRYGMILPIGIEAFPFPFQNGGLFFEVAPYFTNDKNNLQNLGIRTTSGFIYYITKKPKNEKI